MRGRKLKKCLLCNVEVKLTAEHILPANLLEKFSEAGALKNEGLMKIDHHGTTNFSNLRHANVLKPVKNLCPKCNNERSTDCDVEFSNFIWGLYEWGKLNPAVDKLKFPEKEEIQKRIAHILNAKVENEVNSFTTEGTITQAIIETSELMIIVPKNWNEQLLKKYIVKHAICYLERIGEQYSEELSAMFLSGHIDGRINFKAFLLSPKFNFGCSNGGIKFYPDCVKYNIVFANVLIEVQISLELIKNSLVV